MAHESLTHGEKPSATRSRLILSFAAALAFGLMAGPFCAVAHLLDNAEPTVFFSPARYVFVSTAASVGIAAAAAIVGIPLLALTACSWRRCGRSAQWAWLVVALLFVGLITANDKGMLPLPGDLLPSQDFWVEGCLGLALAWAVVGVFFASPSVQIAAYPLLLLQFLLKLANLATLGSLVIAAALIVLAFSRYSTALRSLAAETISMCAFVVVPLVAFVHVRVGHYVLALDAPYSLALVGLVGVVIAAIFVLRSFALAQPSAGPVVSLIIFCAVTAFAAIWSQYPPPLPQGAVGDHDRPNIILIVWDTVRARQLGQYGYRRDLAPGLGNLAAQGVLFERTAATSCWTLPTHASMFTGLYPREHAAAHGGYHRMRQESKTIAEVLSQAGYKTIGLTANHWYAGTSVAIDQGFDDFYDPGMGAETSSGPMGIAHDLLYPYDERTIDVQRGLRRWLFAHGSRDQPVFVFINLFEAHIPYTPPERLFESSVGLSLRQSRRWAGASLAQRHVVGPAGPKQRDRAWAAITDLYDAEIRYVDEATDRLLAMFDTASGPEGNTLSIVTSDHGENLGEHDLGGHDFSLHETLLHVPLVAVWPGQFREGIRIPDRVTQRDLFATIADAAELPESIWTDKDCRSLLPMCKTGRSARQQPAVFAEAWPSPVTLAETMTSYLRRAPLGRFISPLLAVYGGKYKYIKAPAQHSDVLYDLSNDPAELRDLSDERPQQCKRMSRMIDEWLERTPNNMPKFSDGYEKGPLKR